MKLEVRLNRQKESNLEYILQTHTLLRAFACNNSEEQLAFKARTFKMIM